MNAAGGRNTQGKVLFLVRTSTSGIGARSGPAKHWKWKKKGPGVRLR
jgi:hypothetical protein